VWILCKRGRSVIRILAVVSLRTERFMSVVQLPMESFWFLRATTQYHCCVADEENRFFGLWTHCTGDASSLGAVRDHTLLVFL
jgi:hypothetical protein